MSTYTPDNVLLEPFEGDLTERGWNPLGNSNQTAIVSGGLTNNCAYFDSIFGATLNRSLATSSSYTIGFALNFATITAASYQFLRSGTVQVSLNISTSGIWSMKVGSSTVWTNGSATVTTGNWNYIEFQVVIAASGGSIQVRQNQVVLGTYTGDTKNAADTLIDEIYLSLGSQSGYIDDLYITGGSASQYLGMVKLYQFLPTSDGTHQNYTPNSGSTHYSRVNQMPSDDDTTYVADGTSGDADSYVFSGVTSGGAAIKAMQHSAIARTDQTGVLNFKTLLRLGGTDYISAVAEAPVTSYAWYPRATLLNPATGLAWAASDITAGEMGTTIV